MALFRRKKPRFAVEPRGADVEAAMNAIDFVKVEDRGDTPCIWFQANPDVMYPAALEYVGRMRSGTDLIPSYLRFEMVAACRLPDEAWEYAMRFKDETPVEFHAIREAALEHARRVFTAVLRKQAGGPIGFHILRGVTGRWRL